MRDFQTAYSEQPERKQYYMRDVGILWLLLTLNKMQLYLFRRHYHYVYLNLAWTLSPLSIYRISFIRNTKYDLLTVDLWMLVHSDELNIAIQFVWKTRQMNVQNDFISIWFWCAFLTNFQQLIQIFQFYVLLLCWRVEKQNVDISHLSIRIKHFNICIKWGGGSNWILSES